MRKKSYYRVRPAIVLQILHAKCSDKSESEMTELALKIEANMRRFDKTQKGKLTVDDIYNVVKVGPTKNNTYHIFPKPQMDSNKMYTTLDTIFWYIVLCAFT